MRVPNTQFGQRAAAHQQKRQFKIRYFLAFEGEKTECQYFHGILKNRDELNINPIIEIVPLSRHEHQAGLSNPVQICQLMKTQMELFKTGTLTLNALVNHLSDWILAQSKKPRNQRKQISSMLLRDLKKKYDYQPETQVSGSEDPIVQEICELLKIYDAIEVSEQTISEFKQYLKKQREYSKRDGDKACIIIDRDPGSFTPEQYDMVLAQCKKSGLELYVTNPRFEFWLLLHFLTKSEMDTEKICAPSEPGKEAYLENCLHQHCSSFSKHHVPFELFKDKIPQAIENEKGFCEEVTQLKDHIGCNIGLLITNLLQQNKL